MTAERTALGWWAALICLLVLGAPLGAGDARPIVVVAKVDGMIDLGLAPFVARVIEEAEAVSAAAVVLEVNTFGGRVDAAVVIRDALLRSRVPTVAFVNKRAISAGALISLAAEKVAVAGGATIGAATPVLLGEPGAQPETASEKTVSYMRKEFAATAEARGRPALLAEAMVDADVEIPGVIEKGKLLTLTGEEALRHGVAELRADDLGSVLEHMGLAGAEIRGASENWAEALLRFLTHPVVSSLLLTLGILGVVTELRTPGFGAPGVVGLLCLALLFWGHSLVQLVGWEEIVLVGVGLVLLALEAFVLPGFGVAGVLGIAALVAGVSLSLIGAGETWSSILATAGRVLVSFALAATGALAMLRFLPTRLLGRGLVLQSVEVRAVPASAIPSRGELLGSRGVALTPLRPGGFARIDGERVDVVSEGDLIEAGEPVEVIRVVDDRLVVKRGAPPSQAGTA